MAASTSAAYATYRHNVVLNEVVKTLGRRGFHQGSIFMMLSPMHPVAMTVRDSSVGRFELVSSEATTGLIDWLSQFGAVVIPTFGFFTRSREFFHALAVEHDSGAKCGTRGTLARLGFSQEDAERFERRVRAFGVLVYISCPESEAPHALELLRTSGAEEAGLLPGRDGDVSGCLMVCPGVLDRVPAEVRNPQSPQRESRGFLLSPVVPVIQ
jgi:hypothetical protein